MIRYWPASAVAIPCSCRIETGQCGPSNRPLGVRLMTNPNKHKAIDAGDVQNREEAMPSQEVLLGDLTGTEAADQIFEGMVDPRPVAGQRLETLQSPGTADGHITGGDLDDDVYQAEVVGEEAIGGQTPTPDQNVTEELQQGMGIAAADGSTVRTNARLKWRDQHRWQLDPESAEDYQERQ